MKLAWMVLGLAALWIAVASPLASLDHHFLTAHMAQHLVLMVIAAPSFMLGAPSFVFRWRLPPASCWLAGTLTVMLWHVPMMFELAMRSHRWHDVEQLSFFGAGILFWWPVIHSPVSAVNSSRWSIPVYLFLATLPCDALSAFLVFCDHVVYPTYRSGGAHFQLSPQEDQALAGALMWVAVTFAYLVPALLVTAKLLSGEQAHTALYRMD